LKTCDHDALRADAAAWAALPLVGVMRIEGEPTLELRNCPCGSTLSIETKEIP
jgi:hypothetical protein